jgi:two-component system nitrate/nitrite response regulator NarL
MRRQSFATVLIGKNILVREGIARILRAEHFRILASVSSVDELPSTLQSLQLLFLIVQAGDDFDLAVEHIGLVRDQHPGGRIAMVANHDRPAELALAFRAGASGYFVNVNSCDAFIKSIELVAMGETVFRRHFYRSLSIPKVTTEAKQRYPMKTSGRSSSPRTTRSRRNSRHGKNQFCAA